MTDHEESKGPAEASSETNTAIGAATNVREKPTTEQLEAAILTLRPYDRAIFLTHRLDAMSYRQMAEVTGLSIRQIEKAMARAIGDVHRTLHGKPPRRRRWWLF